MHNVHDCPPLRWRVNDGCKHQAKRHCSVLIYHDESASHTTQTGSRPRLIVPLMAYYTDDVPDMYLAHASHEYLTSFLFSELVLVDAPAALFLTIIYLLHSSMLYVPHATRIQRVAIRFCVEKNVICAQIHAQPVERTKAPGLAEPSVRALRDDRANRSGGAKTRRRPQRGIASSSR